MQVGSIGTQAKTRRSQKSSLFPEDNWVVSGRMSTQEDGSTIRLWERDRPHRKTQKLLDRLKFKIEARCQSGCQQDDRDSLRNNEKYTASNI